MDSDFIYDLKSFIACICFAVLIWIAAYFLIEAIGWIIKYKKERKAKQNSIDVIEIYKPDLTIYTIQTLSNAFVILIRAKKSFWFMHDINLNLGLKIDISKIHQNDIRLVFREDFKKFIDDNNGRSCISVNPYTGELSINIFADLDQYFYFPVTDYIGSIIIYNKEPILKEAKTEIVH